MEDHLTSVTEETDGITATAAGEQTLEFAQGTGRDGDIQIGFTARGVLKTQDGQTMAIGGSAFEAVLIETEMHTGQQLFGLIAAAGEQGGAQPLNEDVRIQLDRRACLSQGELWKVIRRHTPHLITAGDAGEFDLLTAVFAAEGDRTVRGHSGDDLAKETGRQGDRTAGGNGCTQARLNTEAEIKPGQAQPAGSGICSQQHIGEHRVGGTRCDCPAHQLKTGTQFGLGADQLHGRTEGASTLPQPKRKRNG